MKEEKTTRETVANGSGKKEDEEANNGVPIIENAFVNAEITLCCG